jgi:MinD-like ATPase involved in chromosome partitioning or flagellar assembly
VSTVASNLAAGLYTRSKADVVLAELTPGQGSLAFELGLPSQSGLSEALKGKSIEITREKVQSSLIPHNMGVRILGASDNPRDIDLMTQVDNFEALILRLGGLARFIVLDLGSGLPKSIQKSLSLCSDRIVVLEGTASSIHQTKILLNEMSDLGIDMKTISVVLNNRQRSEAQIPWAQVQERLGHPITTSLTPASELFMQASKLNTPALVAQPEHMVSQQLLKLADAIIEREKAR